MPETVSLSSFSARPTIHTTIRVVLDHFDAVEPAAHEVANGFRRLIDQSWRAQSVSAMMLVAA